MISIVGTGRQAQMESFEAPFPLLCDSLQAERNCEAARSLETMRLKSVSVDREPNS